jgi:hypothetical protein
MLGETSKKQKNEDANQANKRRDEIKNEITYI